MERQTEAEIVLALDSTDQPPFDYRAELTYALTGNGLTMRLAVQHRGAVPIPYGLGFHPWLPRTPGTLLELPATEVWLETADHMPAGKVPVGGAAGLGFRPSTPAAGGLDQQRLRGLDRHRPRDAGPSTGCS